MNRFEQASLFLLVVEQGSLAGAARLKNISPSVVSKRLAELESALGVQLLRRTTRRMTLTEAGESFYKQMRHLDGQWQSLLDETASLGQEAKGILRLAAPQPVLTRVLLDVVTAFRQAHPQIEVVLQTAEYTQLPLAEADISLCRMLEKLDTATTVGVPICHYRNALFASPIYLANTQIQELNTLDDLKCQECLPYGLTSPNTWSFINNEGAEKSLMVNSKLLTNNTEVIIQAAIAAQGVAYIPGMIITQELAENKLQPILTHLASRDFQLWAYYQKLDYVPLKVRLFLDFIKDYFADRQ
ncbi:LysR family transcriptional regulator [Marinomonas sp. PE14-40]|uniref:LysR family transcriptional regulator n=1 Tax=Marinomonas sp. PE14-40 TaxID=3060621 RepID=UPI003F67B93B